MASTATAGAEITAFQTFRQQYLCGGKGILQASEGVGL